MVEWIKHDTVAVHQNRRRRNLILTWSRGELEKASRTSGPVSAIIQVVYKRGSNIVVTTGTSGMTCDYSIFCPFLWA